MVLVDRHDFYDAYKAIQADAASCPVVVLVSAADCDSCCAYRTLRALFKADNVPFSAYPVAGYEDVQQHAAKLAHSVGVRFQATWRRPRPCASWQRLARSQERMLVLINCGGTENLLQLRGARPAAPCRRFLCRPPF